MEKNLTKFRYVPVIYDIYLFIQDNKGLFTLLITGREVCDKTVATVYHPLPNFILCPTFQSLPDDVSTVPKGPVLQTHS